MAYGVQVKANISVVDVDAEKLRKAVQKSLDDATSSNPISIKHFSAKISKKSASSIRSAVQKAIDTSTSDSPIQIKNIGVKVSAKDRNAAIKDLKASLDETGLTLSIKKIDASNAVKALKQQLTTMLGGLSITGVRGFLGTDGVEGAYDKNTQAANRLAEAQEKVAESQKKVQQTTSATKASLAELSVLKSTTTRVMKSLFDISDDDVRSDLHDRARDILQEIESASKASSTEQSGLLDNITKTVQALKDEAAAQKEVEAAARKKAEAIKAAGGEDAYNAQQAAKAAQQQEAAELKQQRLINRSITLKNTLTNMLRDNSDVLSSQKEKIDALINEIGNGDGMTAKRLEEINEEIIKLKQNLKDAGAAPITLQQGIKNIGTEMSKFVASYITMQKLLELFRSMFNAVRDLDAAMTELRKVTDLTEKEYSDFMKTATNTARDIGVLVSDTVNATADFARLGFSVDEAHAMAEAALVYKNVGDGIKDVSTATESLISTIKAFNIDAEDSMFIVDKFNEVGNNFAISSSGVGEALKRSASALAAAGNDIDESIGLIVGMNSVVQDPESVGTALKTISMYLRAAKTEAEEAGVSTDGMANSVSELRNELLRLTGVDIMLDDETFKSTYQIMQELSEVWDKLSDISQANVLNLIGGKRNGNIITSLITNFDDAAKAMATSQDAYGSALRENEKYIDSINGQITKLKSNFESLSSAVINSNFVKTFISALNALLELCIKLEEAINAVTAALAFLGAAKVYGVATGTKGLLASITGLLGVLSNLHPALKAIAITLTAIAGGYGLYKAVHESDADKARAVADNYQYANEVYQSNIKTLGELKNRYEELANGVDANGKNIGLTADEYAEFKSILSQIEDISPDVISGYTEQGEQLDKYTGAVDRAIASQEEYIKNEREMYTSNESGKTLFAGWKEDIKSANNEIVKYGMDALEDAVTTRYGIFGFANYDVLSNALQGIGIDIASTYEGLGTLGVDEFKQIYAQRDEFLRLLRESLAETNEYTDQQIDSIITQTLLDLGNVGELISQINETKRDAADYIIDRISSDGDFQKTYDIIENVVPVGAMDEYRDAIASVIDPQESFTSNIERAIAFTKSFGSVMESDVVKNIAEMAAGLETGDTTLEEFNTALNGIAVTSGATDTYKAAVEAIISYYASLTNQVRETTGAVEEFTPSMKGISTVLSSVTKANSALEKAKEDMAEYGGITYETIQSISDLLGETGKVTDYIKFDELGNVVLDEDAWSKRTQQFYDEEIAALNAYSNQLISRNKEIRGEVKRTLAYINGDTDSDLYDPSMYETSDQARAALREYSVELKNNADTIKDNKDQIEIYEATQNKAYKSASDEFKARQDAEKSAITAIDVFKKAREEIAEYGSIQRDTLIAIRDTVGADRLSEFVIGNGWLVESKVEPFIKSILDLAGIKPEDTIYTAIVESIGEDDGTAQDRIENLEEAIEHVTSIINFWKEAREQIAEQGYIGADLYSKGLGLFGVAADQLFAEAEGGVGFVLLEDEMRKYTDTAMSANGITGALAKSLWSLIDSASGADKIGTLTDALDGVTSKVSMMSKIQEELSENETNSLDTLASFIEMYGEGWEQYVKFTDGIKISTKAIEDKIDAEIEGMAVSKKTKAALKEVTLAALQTAEANQALEDSYKGIKTVAQTIGGTARDSELSYDDYRTLIEQDTRYAAAVHYQNGVMTLNRDIFNEVTDAIIRETQAQAANEIALAMADERYQELIKKKQEYGKLTEEELSYVNGIEAQIMGWTVLAKEIDNAYNALNRFINSDNEAGASTYNSAVEAAQLIDAVLHDKDSEWYGRKGEERFLAAKDLLIRPDIDMSVAEKSIKRYFTEDQAGIGNFVNDLVKKGFLDENNVLLTTPEEVAKKLNLTTEAVRYLADEYNTFADEAHQIKIEPAVSTTATDEGTESANTLIAQAQTASDAMTSVTQQAETAKLAVESINTMEMTIDNDRAMNSLKAVISKLSQVGSMIDFLANKSINISTKVNTTTTSSSSSGGIIGAISGIASSIFGGRAAAGGGAAAGGKTLVGEVGREIVVDPGAGRWYTVGDRGAEFVNLPEDAIVFNAEQTRALLSSGSLHGHGESMAGGNANASGLLGTLSSLVNTAVTEFKNGIKKVASIATPGGDDDRMYSNLDTTVGSGSSKKKKKSSGSSGSSKNDSSSAEDEMTELEKLLEKYEKILDYSEHLIEHQEHVYNNAERALDFGGMEDSLTEQVRIYRQIMSDAQAAISEMKAAGATDADKELQDMERAYWDAYESMYDALDQINKLYVDGLNDKIDGIQDAFDTLADAAKEMSDSGAISTDTFQKLMEHGLQYMSIVEKVGDRYVINKDKVADLIAAEREQLAVETALSYLQQMQTALTNGSADAVDNLIGLNNEISNSTWAAVYAQAEMLKNLGLSDEQYKAIIKNLNTMRDISENVADDLSDQMSDLYKEQKDAIDYILKKTQELIKYETEERIDAIEQEVDAYKEIISLKKESLRASKEENDYQKSVAEKTEEIAKLQAKLSQLSLDDSREAAAQRAEYADQLASLQEELGSTQSDHALSMAEEMLDKQAEQYEADRQAEIDALEERISSTEKIYQAALDRLNTGWDTIYQELIDWNTEAGNTLNSEITENWKVALEAAKEYGSYVAALKAYESGDGASPSVAVDKDMLPIYHSGGEVMGKRGDEVVALLEQGELVMTNQAKEGLYKAIDIIQVLGERLGAKIKPLSVSTESLRAGISGASISAGSTPYSPVTTNSESMAFSPTINVNVEYSGNASRQDVDDLGNRIANTTLDKLYTSFVRRGIGTQMAQRLRT